MPYHARLLRLGGSVTSEHIGTLCARVVTFQAMDGSKHRFAFVLDHARQLCVLFVCLFVCLCFVLCVTLFCFVVRSGRTDAMRGFVRRSTSADTILPCRSRNFNFITPVLSPVCLSLRALTSFCVCGFGGRQ